MAALRAEVGYLSAEGFSGEVLYRVRAGELRRTVKEIYTPAKTELLNEIVATKRMLDSFPIIERWAERAESAMRILFRKGEISRIEF